MKKRGYAVEVVLGIMLSLQVLCAIVLWRIHKDARNSWTTHVLGFLLYGSGLSMLGAVCTYFDHRRALKKQMPSGDGHYDCKSKPTVSLSMNADPDYPVYILDNQSRTLMKHDSAQTMNRYKKTDVLAGVYAGWDRSACPLKVYWDGVAEGPRIQVASRHPDCESLQHAINEQVKKYGTLCPPGKDAGDYF